MYLRQQRRQLDESRRLLEQLEERQRMAAAAGGAAVGGAETAQSGTIPSRTARFGTQVSQNWVGGAFFSLYIYTILTL